MAKTSAVQKNQKRIKIIDNFYKEKIGLKTFTENNLNKLFYYEGKQAVIDIINFKIINSKKVDKSLVDLVELFKKKSIPIMPISAKILMLKFKIPEGKQLGLKLKLIEEEWVKNNFYISDQKLDNIIKN